MRCGDCDAAIAEAAAAVTHVQSQSQEVGSGDEGLGLLCFDLSSAETDFVAGERAVETWPIFVFRVTFFTFIEEAVKPVCTHDGGCP